MKLNFRSVACSATIVLLSLAILSVHAEDKRGTGSFDIDKVRELSMNPQPSSSAVAPQSIHRETPNYTLITLRIIGSLALIIVLILFVSWLLRKAGLGGGRLRRGGGSMDVMEVLPLGQNKNVVLLRLMDTVYLCGQTASNVTLLDKIEGPRAAELLTAGKGRSPVVQFKEAFNQFIAKVKK